MDGGGVFAGVGEQTVAVERAGAQLIGDERRGRNREPAKPFLERPLAGQAPRDHERDHACAKIFCQRGEGHQQRGQRKISGAFAFSAFDPKNQRPNPECEHEHIAHDGGGGDEKHGREQRQECGEQRALAEMIREPISSERRRRSRAATSPCKIHSLQPNTLPKAAR